MLFMVFTVLEMAVGCRTGEYSADKFLAYCRKPTFGDYEHGAIYYGLDSKMIEHLRQADVVMVGDSEMLMAFSEDNVDRFFRERGIKYFLLGFGYGESSDFALALFKKFQLNPRLVIIDTDPFFRRYLSEPAKEVMSNSELSLVKYQAKQISQAYYLRFCSYFPSACEQIHQSIYRSVSTGRWYWHYTHAAPDLTKPFGRDIPAPDPALMVDGALVGKDFFSEIPLNRHCVILTGVPTPEYDTAPVANILAEKLGTAVVNVSVDNLATIDRGHLNAISAKRWSTVFLSQIEGYLANCVAGSSQRGAVKGRVH